MALAEENGKTLLISESVLDAVPYDNTAEPYQWSVQSPRPQKDVEWATSSIRTWLNGEFLNAAFSADEKGAIAATTLADTKNNVSHTAATAADPSVHAAEETTDQVFLLSLAEAKQYFANNAARVAHPTDYAVKQGVYVGVASNDEQRRRGGLVAALQRLLRRYAFGGDPTTATCTATATAWPASCTTASTTTEASLRARSAATLACVPPSGWRRARFPRSAGNGGGWLIGRSHSC